MKNSIVGLSILVTLLCGWLLFQKNREVQQALARARVAEEKQEAVAAAAAQQEEKSGRLQTQLRQTRAKALENEAALQQLRQQSSTNQVSSVKHKDLSDLYRDQAIQEMARDEAKSGTARHIKALFDAGLAQQLNLNDGQTASLKELLTQKASLFWDQMLIPMIAGDLDEAGMAAAGNTIKQGLADNTAQLRALLGNDGYDVYQWYDKTQPERDSMNQFSQGFAEAGQNLSAEQQNQLLAIMTDRAVNFKYQFDPGDPSQLDFAHWYDNFTDEKINTLVQDREKLNNQILQNANAVLTPEQASLFKQFLSQQLQQARLTMQMTTATFASRH